MTILLKLWVMIWIGRSMLGGQKTGPNVRCACGVAHGTFGYGITDDNEKHICLIISLSFFGIEYVSLQLSF